jgi:hypothetical protein
MENEANDRARQRLIDLAAALRPKQWETRLENGWTVATVFAHLGFWDAYSFVLIDRYEREGVTPVPIDYNAVNAASAALFDTLRPEQCYAWAVRSAESVDAKIRLLPEALAREIAEKDSPRRIARHLHRAAHLDKVEARLKG